MKKKVIGFHVPPRNSIFSFTSKLKCSLIQDRSGKHLKNDAVAWSYIVILFFKIFLIFSFEYMIDMYTSM